MTAKKCNFHESKSQEFAQRFQKLKRFWVPEAGNWESHRWCSGARNYEFNSKEKVVNKILRVNLKCMFFKNMKLGCQVLQSIINFIIIILW